MRSCEISVEEITLHFLVRSFTMIVICKGILSMPLLRPHEVHILIGFQNQLPFSCTSIRPTTVLLESRCIFGILSLQTLGSYTSGIGMIFPVHLGINWNVALVDNLRGWLGDSSACTQRILHEMPSNHPSMFTGWTWALIIPGFPLEGVSYIQCVCVTSEIISVYCLACLFLVGIQVCE